MNNNIPLTIETDSRCTRVKELSDAVNGTNCNLSNFYGSKGNKSSSDVTAGLTETSFGVCHDSCYEEFVF